jgi:predicted DsbA family dithiol-disulfide isomerase
MSRSDYVMRKFGGEERARRLYASIADIGRSEGVMFRFDRIRRTPSSVDAHRLVRWAAAFGRADEVVEAIFAAHFSDGRDIGDIAVLAAIAASCG